MKIVQISTSATYGGAAIAAFRLHRGLMKTGEIDSLFIQRTPVDDNFAIENNIYTPPTSRNVFSRIRKKYNIHTEHYHWLNLNKRPVNYEIATFPTTSYRLEDLPVIKEADIIHLHWVADFLNYPTFFRNIRQPIVWTLHDMNPFMGVFHYEGDNGRNPAFATLDQKARTMKLKAIHQHKDISIVCLSEWMKEKSESSQALGVYPHYIIPNGLDFANFPVPDREKAKERLEIDPSRKTILFVSGGLDIYRKGFDLLTGAIGKIDRTDYNLISVGGDKIDVKSGIRHIHYNRIEDTGLLNKLYAAADLTVIPSREDNLPNVMLESIANGTPVMSFSNGGMAGHISTGTNGILINETGTAPLAAALEDFLNNKYIFDNVNIREYALTHFSDGLQTKKYIQLYKDILSR